MEDKKEQNVNERKEQTVLYDDFEQACIKEGIEIVEAGVVKAADEGKGASGSFIRTTAPSYDNPFYLKKGMGGYNPCVLISGNSCLANCVGYAHGAFLEEAGIKYDGRVPTCNARDFLNVAQKNGLPTGSAPKIGAIIVWWSEGYGHVGIVVGINGDTITVAQSNYGGTRFFLTAHKKPYNIYGQTCIGFVYNPYFEGNWRKDGTGWWYDYGNGSYPVNKWELINGTWYHFDAKGYMQTGWIEVKDIWYYLDDSGAMVTGWKYIKEKWYCFNAEGAMQTGWQKIDGKWYYFGSDGAMYANQWLNYNGHWYCFGSSGAMLTGKHTVPAHFNSDGALDG